MPSSSAVGVRVCNGRLRRRCPRPRWHLNGGRGARWFSGWGGANDEEEDGGEGGRGGNGAGTRGRARRKRPRASAARAQRVRGSPRARRSRGPATHKRATAPLEEGGRGDAQCARTAWQGRPAPRAARTLLPGAAVGGGSLNGRENTTAGMLTIFQIVDITLSISPPHGCSSLQVAFSLPVPYYHSPSIHPSITRGCTILRSH